MAAVKTSLCSSYSTMFGLILMMAWSSTSWASSWQENVRPIMYVPYGKFVCKFFFYFYSSLCSVLIKRNRKWSIQKEKKKLDFRLIIIPVAFPFNPRPPPPVKTDPEGALLLYQLLSRAHLFFFLVYQMVT